ncbi:MAG: DoxX family protein, partial [Cellulomonas sp.]|nr:DoxX family protein [Cellulomonas sp.]
MLLRPFARPLFASWFVAEGIDALRHPAVHATAGREGLAALHGHVGRLPGLSQSLDRALTTVTDTQLGLVVRAHGAATIVAAPTSS